MASFSLLFTGFPYGDPLLENQNSKQSWRKQCRCVIRPWATLVVILLLLGKNSFPLLIAILSSYMCHILRTAVWYVLLYAFELLLNIISLLKQCCRKIGQIGVCVCMCVYIFVSKFFLWRELKCVCMTTCM